MKNTKAKFTNITKLEIHERDNLRCIFCIKPPMDIHHVFFGQQANYSKERNKPNQGVTVCRDCHNEIHSCSIGEGKRQQAIDYLIKP